MSVALELPALTISSPTSDKIYLKASLSTERLPYQFKCGCFSETLQGDSSFSVFSFHYVIIGAMVLFYIAYLAFAENSSLLIGIITILSTCIGYVVPKPKP